MVTAPGETRGQFDLSGIQPLIVGLAREGTTLARFLAEHGADVTVTDAKPAEELGENLTALGNLAVNLALGGHPLGLLDGKDIVFVSPGVPLEIPLLEEARRRHVPLSSETRLFARLCPARIVGITGSSGKTTTTALLGQILTAAGYETWIGGNIGQPLIGSLNDIAPTDTVVMELSSFQLELFAPWPEENHVGQPSALFDPAGWSPPVAAVLNLTPNHLDRHGTMEAYTAAKYQILAHQSASGVAVLNMDDPATREIGETAGRDNVWWFSLQKAIAPGAFLRGDELVLRMDDQESVICQVHEIGLPGRHNIANTLAACSLAGATGAPISAMRQAALAFRGVPHRLQLISEHRGARWYDDSIATAPERTVAALEAFPDSAIVLLAGGRDKNLDWSTLADLACQRVHHIILFGEAANLIEEAVQGSRFSASGSCCLHHAGDLEGAVQLAAQVVAPGDIVLLSPGGTSFDVYVDYAARGEHYQQLVKALE